MTNIGIHHVLLNHSSQSRWSKRSVFVDIKRGEKPAYFVKSGRRFVPAYRLYKDSGSTRQVASGFMVEERVR